MLKSPNLGELDSGLQVRVYLCTSATDMLKGYDTPAPLVREQLKHDPLSGSLFLFVGRNKDRIRLLYRDTDRFAVWYQRLEDGTFRLPNPKTAGASVELKASELGMLLSGIELTGVKRRKCFARSA